jgi:hypothetical protein
MEKIVGDVHMAGYSDRVGSLEITKIWAGGQQSEPPNLNMRAEIKLKPLNAYGQQQAYSPVSLLRVTGEFRSPEHRILSRFQNDEPLFAQDPNREASTQVTFEIPMDVLTIHKIEEERNGSNLRAGLKIRMLLALHGNQGNITFHAGGVMSDLIFTIARSDWVESCLPGLGYGGLEVLEVRYGTGSEAAGLRNSVAEIKEAKKYLAEGQWDKVALHCRMATEEILALKPLSSPSPHFEQKVNTFISDNLPGIDDTEARMLADQMKLIWKAASTAAHGNPQHTFKRADAEFVLRMTMAIVEYFSRLLR